jgi:hypothetical protein
MGSGSIWAIPALSISCDARITPSFRLELDQIELGRSISSNRSLVFIKKRLNKTPASVVY